MYPYHCGDKQPLLGRVRDRDREIGEGGRVEGNNEGQNKVDCVTMVTSDSPTYYPHRIPVCVCMCVYGCVCVCGGGGGTQT